MKFSLAMYGFLLILLSLLWVGMPAYALPPALILDDTPRVTLGDRVEYFREEGVAQSLSDALAHPDAAWQVSTRPGYMVLGLTEDVYWIRFALQSLNDKVWLFEARYFFNGSVDIYLLPRGDDGASTNPLAPEYKIASARKWGQRHYTKTLSLKPQQVYDVYVRIEVPGPDKFAFVIEDQDARKQFEFWDNHWVGAFYGGFVTMLLFNLFLAVSTRSLTYGYYLAYMMSMMIYLLMMDGFVQAELSRYYIAICGVVAFGCQFCRNFLRTQTLLPGPDRYVRGLIWGSGIMAIGLVAFGPLVVLTNLVMVLVAGYSLVLGCVGLLARLRGNQVARFFLLAWVFPLIGMLYTILMYSSITPFTDAGYSAMNIATLLEAILLSMALADRINMLRIQRQRAIVDAKQKLEMSNRALEKANKLKDGFLGTISHELRTPMNGIIGTLELMKATAVDANQRESINTLEASSTQMLGMVERILLFSELQSGAVRAKPLTLNVRNWCQRLKQEWTPLFEAKGLRYSMYVDGGCSDWISVDSKKLDFLLAEIVGNALKFTAQGDVSLELRQAGEAGNLQWILDLRDTGVGIPTEQLQLISESFRQGQSAYNRQYGGLGIGMAICKELVSALGGQWRVDSTPGAGTHISIVIPVAAAEAPALANEPPAKRASPAVKEAPVQATPVAATMPKEMASLQVVSSAALKPPAILVVEDNAVNQMVMKKILESLGWTYCIANNGVEAVEKAREKPFALILMDCQMPEMDGFAATEAIRAGDNPNQPTPIVAVTANATEKDREHCIASGMNDYLKKPVKPIDIKGMIERYVATSLVDNGAA